MKKLHSKIVAILLVFSTIVSFLPTTNASAETVHYCKYIDKNFYGRSAPEPITLDLVYDTISIGAISEGGIDNITCHIDDVSAEHPGIFTYTFDIDTDESVYTFPISFPNGRYKIYFTGNSDIKKTFACVIFSKEDPLVQLEFPWPI